MNPSTINNWMPSSLSLMMVAINSDLKAMIALNSGIRKAKINRLKEMKNKINKKIKK